MSSLIYPSQNQTYSSFQTIHLVEFSLLIGLPKGLRVLASVSKFLLFIFVPHPRLQSVILDVVFGF